MRARFGMLIALFQRGPHGKILLTSATLSAVVSALLLSTFWWQQARPIVVQLAAVLLLGMNVVVLALLTRLRAATNDVRYALAFDAAVRTSRYSLPEFFMEEAAATPSFELCSLKILTFCQPARILELGSGQSTKVLSAYARENPSVEVLTLEQDPAWAMRMGPTVSHARHTYLCTPLTPQIVHCQGTDLVIRSTWYRDVTQVVANRWNYVLVDGPNDEQLGTAHTDYARSGLLQHIPGILDNPFVILFDDVDAFKYMMTARACLNVLKACHVPHVAFSLHGLKDQLVVCSPEWAFLRSI